MTDRQVTLDAFTRARINELAARLREAYPAVDDWRPEHVVHLAIDEFHNQFASGYRGAPKPPFTAGSIDGDMLLNAWSLAAAMAEVRREEWSEPDHVFVFDASGGVAAIVALDP
jgi:hypothetical protein